MYALCADKRILAGVVGPICPVRKRTEHLPK